MKVAVPLYVLIVVTGVVRASHSFGLSRVSSRHSLHSRLARRSQSHNGRCKVNQYENASIVNPKGKPSSSRTSGVINVQSSCGPIGATTNITSTSGPNGDIDWLNCGVGDGGWRPPYVQVSDIIAKDLNEAIQEPGSPFKACEAYVSLFQLYARQFDVPAILIASLAMQESSCNAETVGGAGEQGLMQLTKDKCGGAPNGNCKDPEYNIRTGTEFFSTTLKNNDGNLLLTLGNYNGWPEGMTFGEATAAANGPCCRCQNNLDYLQQTLNGWAQNVNPYSSNPRIGKYFNLDKCNS
ncbi:hypothetical protein AcV5_009058 [Taiwanofungus camphoratus]|nr:hypothetical protein AcV5_009058 [Antrodia cinnamomea]